MLDIDTDYEEWDETAMDDLVNEIAQAAESVPHVTNSFANDYDQLAEEG